MYGGLSRKSPNPGDTLREKATGQQGAVLAALAESLALLNVTFCICRLGGINLPFPFWEKRRWAEGPSSTVPGTLGWQTSIPSPLLSHQVLISVYGQHGWNPRCLFHKVG